MIEQDRRVIIEALRGAEEHLHYCCSHCTSSDGDHKDYLKIEAALRALGETPMREIQEQALQALTEETEALGLYERELGDDSQADG